MRTKITGVIVAASIATITGSAAWAAAAALRASEPSSVKFEADGPGGLKINGETGGVHLAEEGDKVTVTAPVNTFDTGISLRDKHLKKAIEADKYPTAKFVVQKAQMKTPAANAALDATISGTLTLHGVEKPIDVKYHVVRGAKGLDVKANFAVDLAKFSIEKPCYLGVCVGETVRVSVAFAAHDD